MKYLAVSSLVLASVMAPAAPQDAATHYQNAERLRAKGDLDKAIEEYDEALRLRPNYAEARSGLGWALVTVSPKITAADRAVRARKAIPEFQRALRLKPNEAEAHFGLAWAHLILSDGQPREAHLAEVDKAIPELHEALRLKPDLGSAHATLASTLEDKGDLDGAVAEYQAGLRLRPDYAKATWISPAFSKRKEILKLRLPNTGPRCDWYRRTKPLATDLARRSRIRVTSMAPLPSTSS